MIIRDKKLKENVNVCDADCPKKNAIGQGQILAFLFKDVAIIPGKTNKTGYAERESETGVRMGVIEMKGKIRNGVLVLFRKDNEITQKCSFRDDEYCNHQCPHFSEPRVSKSGVTSLEICHGKVLYFDEFIDER